MPSSDISQVHIGNILAAGKLKWITNLNPESEEEENQCLSYLSSYKECNFSWKENFKWKTQYPVSVLCKRICPSENQPPWNTRLYDNQAVPLALITNVVTTCIGSKVDRQVAPLALVPNLATRLRNLHRHIALHCAIQIPIGQLPYWYCQKYWVCILISQSHISKFYTLSRSLSDIRTQRSGPDRNSPTRVTSVKSSKYQTHRSDPRFTWVW